MVNNVGLHQSGQEIFSGKFFNVLAPDPAAIDIRDIAHALSMICRFNGHCLQFYSVAQHSLLVAACLEEMEESRETMLAGLLHDAAEAYVADLIRPLKCLDQLQAYREAESQVQAAIVERFDLYDAPNAREAIHLADNMVLRAEARDLMRSRGEGWKWNGIEAWDQPIIYGLPPAMAEEQFLKRFHMFAGE